MKVSFNEDETLNYITQEEQASVSWESKLFGSRKSIIWSTQDLAQEYKKQIDIRELTKTFKPFKLNFILLAIVGLIFIVIMVNVLVNPKPGEGFNIFIQFLLIFIVVGIIGTIFDKKKNFEIILSQEGIKIKEFTYNWNEIYETYIVYRPKGKGGFYYLILALDTGVTDRYEITNLMELGATDKKLSAYIEHYKQYKALKVNN